MGLGPAGRAVAEDRSVKSALTSGGAVELTERDVVGGSAARRGVCARTLSAAPSKLSQGSHLLQDQMHGDRASTNAIFDDFAKDGAGLIGRSGEEAFAHEWTCAGGVGSLFGGIVHIDSKVMYRVVQELRARQGLSGLYVASSHCRRTWRS